MRSFCHRVLSCCDSSSPTLQIGHPTDFRREDISLPSLSEAEQALIREKAIADAQSMVAAQPYIIPALPIDGSAMPHHSPALPQHRNAITRVRQHARKLSAKMGYGSTPTEDRFASRPISGYSDSRRGKSIGPDGEEDTVKRPFLASQSKDSVGDFVTPNGESKVSVHSEDMGAAR